MISWEDRFNDLARLKKQAEERQESYEKRLLENSIKVRDYFSPVIESFAKSLGISISKYESPVSQSWSIEIEKGCFLQFGFGFNHAIDVSEVGTWSIERYSILGSLRMDEQSAREKLADMLTSWYKEFYR